MGERHDDVANVLSDGRPEERPFQTAPRIPKGLGGYRAEAHSLSWMTRRVVLLLWDALGWVVALSLAWALREDFDFAGNATPRAAEIGDPRSRRAARDWGAAADLPWSQPDRERRRGDQRHRRHGARRRDHLYRGIRRLTAGGAAVRPAPGGTDRGPVRRGLAARSTAVPGAPLPPRLQQRPTRDHFWGGRRRASSCCG